MFHNVHGSVLLRPARTGTGHIELFFNRHKDKFGQTLFISFPVGDDRLIHNGVIAQTALAVGGTVVEHHIQAVVAVKVLLGKHPVGSAQDGFQLDDEVAEAEENGFVLVNFHTAQQVGTGTDNGIGARINTGVGKLFGNLIDGLFGLADQFVVMHTHHHIVRHKTGFGNGIGDAFHIHRVGLGDDFRLFSSFKHQSAAEGLFAFFELGQIAFSADDFHRVIDAQSIGNAFEMHKFFFGQMIFFVHADTIDPRAAHHAAGLSASHTFGVEGHRAADQSIATTGSINVNRAGSIGKVAAGTGVGHLFFFQIFQSAHQAAVGVVQSVVVGGAKHIHTELAQIVDHSGRTAKPAAAGLGAAVALKVVHSGFQIAVTEISLHNKITDFAESGIFALRRQTAGDHRVTGSGTTELIDNSHFLYPYIIYKMVLKYNYGINYHTPNAPHLQAQPKLF